MAPVELKDLSSNWKKLQKTLQSSRSSSTAPKPSKPESAQKQATGDKQELNKAVKRKRGDKSIGTKNEGRSTVVVNKSGKTAVYESHSRKRARMEEPASIGASIKRHDTKSLPKSVSMPSLKKASLLAEADSAGASLDILSASPDHPDIENEGLSETALPGKYIALDCEMVGVGPTPDRDSALARVSLVDYHGHQIYDSYVQVALPVTDYRSAVSGIHSRHLRKDCARTFKEVQSDVRVLLEGRILVGHAVKNDLDCLLLKHEKRMIRDTSKFSKFRELAIIPGRTPSLKGLVEKLLGVEIQVGAHSSVEDARATMALFRLEKEDFEAEILKRYGGPRKLGEAAAAAGESEDEAVPKARNRKKKKKRKH